MRNKIRTYMLVWLLLMPFAVSAQRLSDQARISLLTCTPGEELYARYGHTALRVYDPENDLDEVFNICQRRDLV